MFEISKLKEKKLAELQEIAEELKISKYKTLKKLDLVYKILDHQASNPGDKGDEIKSSSKPKFSPKSRSNKNDVNDKRSMMMKMKDKTRKLIIIRGITKIEKLKVSLTETWLFKNLIRP